MSPEAAAYVLGVTLVYVERKRGQGVGLIEMSTIEEAAETSPSLTLPAAVPSTLQYNRRAETGRARNIGELSLRFLEDRNHGE